MLSKKHIDSRASSPECWARLLIGMSAGDAILIDHVAELTTICDSIGNHVDMFPWTHGLRISLKHQSCPLEPR